MKQIDNMSAMFYCSNDAGETHESVTDTNDLAELTSDVYRWTKIDADEYHKMQQRDNRRFVGVEAKSSGHEHRAKLEFSTFTQATSLGSGRLV